MSYERHGLTISRKWHHSNSLENITPGRAHCWVKDKTCFAKMITGICLHFYFSLHSACIAHYCHMKEAASLWFFSIHAAHPWLVICLQEGRACRAYLSCLHRVCMVTENILLKTGSTFAMPSILSQGLRYENQPACLWLNELIYQWLQACWRQRRSIREEYIWASPVVWCLPYRQHGKTKRPTAWHTCFQHLHALRTDEPEPSSITPHLQISIRPGALDDSIESGFWRR